ncbi:lactonase family protein [Embleya sp. MST-111070]|uniref:lactonase family protein n=1 Tax=Embleya sp. MST-111070 TaxID=3398231 RepID=UPI003F73EC79
MTGSAENHPSKPTVGNSRRRGTRTASRRLMAATGALMTLLASSTIPSAAVAGEGTAPHTVGPTFARTTKASGGSPVVPSPDGRFLYSAGGDGKLRVHTIGADGRLTARPGATTTLPDIPIDVAFSPDSTYAYVTVGVSDTTMQVYALRADGTPVPVGAPLSLGSASLSMSAVSPDGRDLYVTDVAANRIMRYALNDDGLVGGLRETESAVGFGPIFPTLTPDGRHLYVATELGTTVTAFDVAADGSLSPVAGSPFPAGSPSLGMVTSHDGKYLYAPNLGSNSITGFAIREDGALKELPGSPFAGGADGTAPQMAVLSADGKVLWDAAGVPVGGAGAPIVALHGFDVRPDGTLVRNDSAAVGTDMVFTRGRPCR